MVMNGSSASSAKRGAGTQYQSRICIEPYLSPIVNGLLRTLFSVASHYKLVSAVCEMVTNAQLLNLLIRLSLIQWSQLRTLGLTRPLPLH